MNLQYPIGKYALQDYSEKLKNEWLTDIKVLPNKTSYRDEDWH